jgi:uncharacterized delta-60 repeat protein
MNRLASRNLLALFVALSASLVLGVPAVAAPGDLDTSFSSNGKVTTNFTGRDDFGVGVAIQTDGKIIVAGIAGGLERGKFALARYNVGGGLDTTFGGDGKVTTNFNPGREWINALALQPDGKIVAVGGDRPTNGNDARSALARYKANGRLDTSFSGDGKVTTNFTPGFDYAEDVALQADGKIVVAGIAGRAGGRFGLARYNMGGGLDSTFGDDGKVATNFNTGFDLVTAVAVQGDGKIVAAGFSVRAGSNNYRFAAARYNSGGGRDTTFGGDGKVTTNFTPGADVATDMALQTDGRIVLVGGAGQAGGRFALARYNAGGGLDSTFGGDGKVTTNFNTGSDQAGGVAVQGDGKIVTAGWSTPAGSNDQRFAVARYNSGGGRDTTFSGDGKVTTNFTGGNDYVWDMTLQADGKIVAVGRAGGAGGRFAAARYLIS